MRALGQADFAKLEKEYLALLESRRPPPTPPSPIRAVPPHLSQTSPAAALVATTASGGESGSSAGRTGRCWPERPPEYPEGCVVFLRALDPATNKTALKDAVNHLLGRIAPGRADAVVSYVDWLKSADTVRRPLSMLKDSLYFRADSPSLRLPGTHSLAAQLALGRPPQPPRR